MNWLWQIFDPAAIGSFFTQFRNEMVEPAFWIAVGKITWINILLSGDNALVIALACRGLDPKQRLWGMIFGAAAAVILRIIFTGIVATLMELPYLKLVGGLALIVIAAKLLVPEEEDGAGGSGAQQSDHQVALAGHRGKHLHIARGESGGAEPRSHGFRGTRIIPRGIGGIDLDELLEDFASERIRRLTGT